jgi:hypothetical protein
LEDLPMCRWFVITALLGPGLPSFARAEPLPELVGRTVEVTAEKDGQLLFIGTHLKDGEEKSLPPDKIVAAVYYYLAVEVVDISSDGALLLPQAGDPSNGKDLRIASACRTIRAGKCTRGGKKECRSTPTTS